MTAGPPKEFCAKGPLVVLVFLYVYGALSYLLGIFVIGIALLAPLANHYLEAEEGAAGVVPKPDSFTQTPWFRSLVVGACGLLFCFAGRIAQWGIRTGKRMSVQLDGCAMYVRDVWGQRHVVKLEDIAELRVARPSCWTGKAIHVVVRGRGRPLRLPQRLKNREDFVRELVEGAGLLKHHRNGRWEVYRRSDQ